ncbi:MAG: general secretion pathway protein GspB [Betaproteobacteria bacterium]|nr:general secretion pathway protein GspB [Betaproteobacteria bacterium]
MSYILEALSKSEQARQQAAAAPRYSLLPAIGQDVATHPWWLYALAGALVVNAALVYLWLRPEIPRAIPVLKAAERAEQAPLAEERAPAVAANKPAWEVALPAVRDDRPPAPRSARIAEPAAARIAAPARAIPPKTSNPATKEPLPLAARQPSPRPIAKGDAKPEIAMAPPPADVQAQRAPSAAALPAAAQPELPPVSVSGFIHEDGSNGMVIVNEKLVREGDEVSPGLKLEKILHDGLVFNYKGHRFKR